VRKPSAKLIKGFLGLWRLTLSRRRRVPVVRQLAGSDCGAAALTMVLRYHGKEVSLAEVRKALGVSRNGADVASLLRVGRTYGLRARAVRLELEELGHLSTGAILHWEFRHFVVFERQSRASIDVVDPSYGRRSVPIKSFRREFTGVAVIFEPALTFEAGGTRPKRLSGLLGQILEGRDLLAQIISTSFLIQVLSAVMPLLTGVLIDRVVPQRDYSLLLVLTLGYCTFQAFNVLAGFVRAHLLIHLRTQLELRFTLRFLNHLVDLPYSFFQEHTSGDLMVRLGSNNIVRNILTSTTLSTVMDGTMASLYLILLILASAPLTLVVVVLALARLILLAGMRWRQRQMLAESLENQARSQTYQVEMLSGMETLKAMGLERRAAEDWSSLFVEGLNISIKRGRVDTLFNTLLSILGTLTTLILMFYGAFLVLNGSLTLGTMMAFSALAGGFLGPVNNLVAAVLQLQLLEVYLDRLNDVLQTVPEHATSGVTPSGALTGAVALETVSFRYDSGGPFVIDDVSLAIQPRSRVALVGRTGSGKSTLARLIAGLYEPTTGRILFDSRDLRHLDRHSVRAQLGIVTQETQLFGGSIRRNIALSDPGMGLDRVVRAAKLACIHDEIIAMPFGYETTLADRGLSLSGGQRQRLAIARAVAGDPRILILDEAMSHLDAMTEERVTRNLLSLSITNIVVAHRLSTIRDADLILVLEAGRIIERGTHDELLTTGMTYARLLGRQNDGAIEMRR